MEIALLITYQVLEVSKVHSTIKILNTFSQRTVYKNSIKKYKNKIYFIFFVETGGFEPPTLPPYRWPLLPTQLTFPNPLHKVEVIYIISTILFTLCVAFIFLYVCKSLNGLSNPQGQTNHPFLAKNKQLVAQ